MPVAAARHVHLAGFSTVRREGILLTAAFTANVSVDMRVGNLEETITVTGEALDGRRPERRDAKSCHARRARRHPDREQISRSPWCPHPGCRRQQPGRGRAPSRRRRSPSTADAPVNSSSTTA